MYLHEKLAKYTTKNRYPMHMPGHKRQLTADNLYAYDITEINGFDNLHHAEDVLREEMERAAEIYGAAHSRFLVNGSSCGVLAAISATVEYGGKILIGRNSHKSAYHALDLRGLHAEYVYPQEIGAWSMQGGVEPAAVREKLQKNVMLVGEDNMQNVTSTQKMRAVFVTSPTYEGMISDITWIAAICHEYGVPLIVDEAHGAHLKAMNLWDNMQENNERNDGQPRGGGSEATKSALDCGADIVIQSLHKTMPTLTQTAILHVSQDAVSSGRVSMEHIDYYLGVYQSSSPSYVLLESISQCMHWLSGDYKIGGLDAREQVKTYRELLAKTRNRLAENKKLHLIQKEDLQKTHCVVALDEGKIVISAKGTNLSGYEFANLLRERFAIEVEMAAQDYIIAMTSFFDTEEGLEKFADAVAQCDAMCDNINMEKFRNERQFPQTQAKMPICEAKKLAGEHPERVCELPVEKLMHGGAVLPEETQVGAKEYISADFIYVYPPGIPIAAPGEIISPEMAEEMVAYYKGGFEVIGCRTANGDIYIKCLSDDEERKKSR